MNRSSSTSPYGDRLLVSTKFVPPRLGTRSILRSRLLDDLQPLGQSRVGLIIASPGFGKTTLLAQWRQQMMTAGADVAWLSLSVDDKALPIFLAYLQGALQRLGAQLEGSLSLDMVASESMEELVAAIVEQLALINRDLYLVIDDYHHVMDPRAHRLMQKLLDHAPDNFHLILASRTLPPLSLSRLRVMGQVVELDGGNLPFDLMEVRQFLEQNAPQIALSAEELHLLYHVSGGWPASLQLILLMLKNHTDAGKALRDLAWKSGDLQAYLSEDVMAHLPVELAEFMERLSICRRFNASLAQALSARPDALELLQRLEEENVLIYRVETEDRRTWYRFHPLFGDFLSARLSRRGTVLVADLHKSAAHWLGRHGFLAEAVRHAIQSGDTSLAVELVERITRNTVDLDFLHPMLRLLDRLPQDVLITRPPLLFLYCLCYAVLAQPAKAETYLSRIQGAELSEDPFLERNLPVLSATVALLNDHSDVVVTELASYRPHQDDHSFIRYMPLMLTGFAQAAEGRFSDAANHLGNGLAGMDDLDAEIAMLVTNTRIMCLIFEGRFREAETDGTALLARAIALHGHRSVSADMCSATAAEIHYERNRIDEAREAMANRKIVLMSTFPSPMLHANLCRARLDLFQESPGPALAFLERQERYFLRIGQERLVAHLLAETVRIALIIQNKSLARGTLARLEALAMGYGDAAGVQREIPMQAELGRARVALSDAYPEQAMEALKQVEVFADQLSRRQLKVTVLLLMAIAEDDLRHPEATLQALSDALEIGHELGLLRTFIDEGRPLQTLLARVQTKLSSDAPLAAYVAELLATFPASTDTLRTEPPSDANAHTTLTPREVAIIQLIALAMSNKRIALTLSISLETVKWNLKNIYVKLGVSGRYDALNWARKYGVIE